jgi:dienelactone hydrolase
MGADMTLRNLLVGSISKGLIFSGVWVASLAEFSAADASTKKHSYTIDGEKFEGVLAVPQKTSPQAARGLPGILMVHNWMGVTSNTDVQAQALADLGFVVLAADIYGAGQRPKDSKEAGAFAGKYKGDRTLFRKRKFGGAVHSFTDKDAGADNSKGAAYNALADARSWEMMKNFFEDSAVTLAK